MFPLTVPIEHRMQFKPALAWATYLLFNGGLRGRFVAEGLFRAGGGEVLGALTVLTGILPIVHSEGNWNLTILHWGVLGITGALLATLLQLHNLDLPERGETEGKILFQGTVRSVAIGAVSAVLLYAALWGEALGGKIFPDIPTRPATDVYAQLPDKGESSDGTLNAQWEALKNVGLSVFWGVFAGLSPAVLHRMTRLAETSLGEPKSGGDEE